MSDKSENLPSIYPTEEECVDALKSHLHTDYDLERDTARLQFQRIKNFLNFKCAIWDVPGMVDRIKCMVDVVTGTMKTHEARGELGLFPQVLQNILADEEAGYEGSLKSRLNTHTFVLGMLKDDELRRLTSDVPNLSLTAKGTRPLATFRNDLVKAREILTAATYAEYPGETSEEYRKNFATAATMANMLIVMLDQGMERTLREFTHPQAYERWRMQWDGKDTPVAAEHPKAEKAPSSTNTLIGDTALALGISTATLLAGAGLNELAHRNGVFKDPEPQTRTTEAPALPPVQKILQQREARENGMQETSSIHER